MAAMQKIELTPILTDFLNPLGLIDPSDEKELNTRAYAASQAWLNFGRANGLAMDELLTPFGLAGRNLSYDSAIPEIARIWILQYYESMANTAVMQ